MTLTQEELVGTYKTLLASEDAVRMWGCLVVNEDRTGYVYVVELGKTRAYAGASLTTAIRMYNEYTSETK